MSCGRRSERNRSVISSHRSHKNRRGASALGRKLKFESLEDRRLLAVFTVTNLGDYTYGNGHYYATPGSLRDAIISANNSPGADEIVFDGVAGTIELNGGDFDLTETVSITGPGINDLTIDAQYYSRHFNITAATGDFTITGLSLINGNTERNNSDTSDAYNGGSIRSVSGGEVLIDDCLIANNITPGNLTSGGGIYARNGKLTVRNSIVSGNYTPNSGGGIYTKETDLEIESSLIYDNEAVRGGGGIFSVDGSLAVTYSLISGNRSNLYNTWGEAAGIFKTGGSVTIESSIISENESRGGGVGCVYCSEVTVSKSMISGNLGRGIAAYRGNLTIEDCLIIGNREPYILAYSSGGIAKGGGGNLTISGSTISGNSGWIGAGVYADSSKDNPTTVRRRCPACS